MGFLGGLKNIFNKNIECGCEIDDRMLVLLKKKYLHINKNIYVRNKNVCVVVCKGRVCDVILEGKYKITPEVIPETYSRAKIEWLQKNGHNIKKIRASLYYVNLNEFKSFEYYSNNPFKSKSNSVGKVKGCLAGKCSIKVFDPAQFVKFLLGNSNKINCNKIYKKISLLVGNKINHIVQKKKIAFENIVENQEYCEGVINSEIEDALDKEGIFVSNIKLKAVDLSKKSKEKVGEYLSKRNKPYRQIRANSVINNIPSSNREVFVNHNVGGVHNTMQTPQVPINKVTINECKICHKKNAEGAKICINCGNKLN